ncbi:MAG: carboxymuconolactone decarboxylase family protein [Deltaproteobacteria bacterium]|nr:carboxymuconolactone decarboxylase family protein [Deltaproteobacteria bacterium]
MSRVPLPTEPPADLAPRSPLGHQPALWDAFLRLYGTLWSRGVLDHPTKEVARLRNARVTGCGYCRSVRFEQARRDGLSEDLVAQIADGFEESTLSERFKLVIRYTDAFLVDPAGIDADLQAAMRREFTAEQIVELTAGIALFMGFSKIAVVLGTVPESMPVMVIPTPA